MTSSNATRASTHDRAFSALRPRSSDGGSTQPKRNSVGRPVVRPRCRRGPVHAAPGPEERLGPRVPREVQAVVAVAERNHPPSAHELARELDAPKSLCCFCAHPRGSRQDRAVPDCLIHRPCAQFLICNTLVVGTSDSKHRRSRIRRSGGAGRPPAGRRNQERPPRLLPLCVDTATSVKPIVSALTMRWIPSRTSHRWCRRMTCSG